MRRLLGSVLPTLLLVTVLGAGCGDEEAGSASDDSTPTASGSPTASGTPSSHPPSDPPSDPKDPASDIDFELVAMLTETAVGGATSTVAVPLAGDTAVQEFTAQFETDAMPTRVQNTVNDTAVPDGMLLYGAVVAIGCDAPTDVHVLAGDAGLVVTAAKVPSPHMECFAPMTTVALLLVPASAVS
jgi:hypothetical protein